MIDMLIAEPEMLEVLLSAYTFHAEAFYENDGSVVVSLDEIALVETGVDESDAVHKMAQAILEYSEDYRNDLSYWARGNGKAHLPYVFKALLLNDAEKIMELIVCRRGKI